MTGITALDQQWFDTVNRLSRDTGWLHGPAALFATYGVLVFAALLVAGVVLGRRAGVPALARALWAGAGVLLAVAVNQPVAALVDHARPFAADPGVLTLVSRSTDPSFPSDHATMAGAAAVGLWLVSRRLGVVAAVLAVVMAATRVYVGVHYPGDVLAGLVLGGLVSGLGWLLLLGAVVGLLERAAAHPRLRPLLLADAEREPVGSPT
ncbi:hypothetical protein GCM10027047_00980 [Rhodococcus aerolatus]